MQVRSALRRLVSSRLRKGGRFVLACLLTLFGCETLQNAVAEGDTRTLSFHHTHRNDESQRKSGQGSGRTVIASPANDTLA